MLRHWYVLYEVPHSTLGQAVLPVVALGNCKDSEQHSSWGPFCNSLATVYVAYVVFAST